jgi:hypothetical protein
LIASSAFLFSIEMNNYDCSSSSTNKSSSISS